MECWHMSGAGNDFMVLDARGKTLDFEALAKELCAKTGADGFMAVDYAADVDNTMQLIRFERDGAKTVTCSKGADSVDFTLVNLISKGDVVITQDYGLAALVLGKGGKALNQNGLIYSDTNIENLLFTRFIGKKERMAGNRTKGPKKRTAQNDADFLKALLLCLG